MSKSLNLVVLYGGKSGEHEVSLSSAASVLANLNPDKYRIFPIGIDKAGHYHLHNYQDLVQYKDKLPVQTALSHELMDLTAYLKSMEESPVVFPVIHGPLYEDGCLQGLLSLADVAYVGCNVLSSALGMDKDIARRLACIDGLKSARYKKLYWNTSEAEKQHICLDAARELGWPLFVKPCSLGSSVGIHKAKNAEELQAAVQDALRYDSEILIEEFINGQEIELAVLENPLSKESPRVSIAGEVLSNNTEGFYSYSAKYLASGSTDLIIPAVLTASLQSQLQEAAAQIFVRLKCQGLARIDFFVDPQKEVIYFGEINTLPGFTSISMYPKLWEATGLAYSELLDELISIACMHHQCRQQLVTSYS